MDRNAVLRWSHGDGPPEWMWLNMEIEAPGAPAKPRRSPKARLTYEDRVIIFALLAEGKKPGEIAGAVGCHRTTVARELKRAPEGAYDPRTAQRDAERAARRPKARKLDANPKQRGGNRVKRSPRTQQIMNYEGRDRGFILRFVNSGTYKANPRSTRLGNRGTITPRNWFTNVGQQQMQTLTQRLSRIIDEEFKKLITQ